MLSCERCATIRVVRLRAPGPAGWGQRCAASQLKPSPLDGRGATRDVGVATCTVVAAASIFGVGVGAGCEVVLAVLDAPDVGVRL